MSNELMTGLGAMPATRAPSKDALLAAGLLGMGYMGQLRIASQGDLVNKHRMPPGNWCYVHGDAVVDLGQTINFLPLAYMPKAIQLLDDQSIVSYEPTSPTFQRICAEKDADRDDLTRFYGIEFLVWFPKRKEFVIIFANNKSMLYSAEALIDLIRKKVRAVTQFHDKGAKKSFYAPVWTETDVDMEMPELERARAEIQKFVDRKDTATEAEVVSADEAQSAREE